MFSLFLDLDKPCDITCTSNIQRNSMNMYNACETNYGDVFFKPFLISP